MPTYIALLRAVNVGGNNMLSMPQLRALLESEGYTDVVTYIQSGNVVFDSTSRKAPSIVAEIEATITREYRARIDVVLRTARELGAVIAANPFATHVRDPKALHVAFLNRAPDRAKLASLGGARFAPDEFAVGRREVYLHCPTGVGRSKLPAALVAKLAPAACTMRNWNTVNKLAELATR